MVHGLWVAARSVFAVLAAIAVVTVVAFAVEIPLAIVILRYFPQTFPDKASLVSNTWWMLSQSLYTIPALVLGGYVAAKLAPGGPLAHAVGMAVVQELLIVTLMFEPPHPVPAWTWAIGLITTPVAIFFGGYLWTRSKDSATRLDQEQAVEKE